MERCDAIHNIKESNQIAYTKNIMPTKHWITTHVVRKAEVNNVFFIKTCNILKRKNSSCKDVMPSIISRKQEIN